MDHLKNPIAFSSFSSRSLIINIAKIKKTLLAWISLPPLKYFPWLGWY